jgi:capsule polysaccharide export protein KpsE/RkpR
MLATAEFTAFEFLDHLKSQARFIGVVSTGAGVLALIVSLLIPKEYTARANILIEPPVNAPASPLTPIYFESLRAYETMASSDSLFLTAIHKFDLGNEPIETLKRRVLKVTKLHETKILEIAVTLRDPAKARAMAQYLAEQTVAMSRQTSSANDADMLESVAKNADVARKELEDAEAALNAYRVKRPVENLRAEVQTLGYTRDDLHRTLLEARTDLAEATAIRNNERSTPVRARVESLEKQDAELARDIERETVEISDRQTRTQELEEKVRVAALGFETAERRVRDVQGAEGTRSEQLRLIDPGVIPQKASFPLTGLNVALAIGVALIACVVYLALTFRPAFR